MDIERRIARLHDLGKVIVEASVRAEESGRYARASLLNYRALSVARALEASLDEWDASVPEDVSEPITEPEPAIEPRQHPDGTGFTPFAWKHLLHDTGFSKDHETRPYILGASSPKRVRIETRTTLTLAFQFYVGREDATHLWVQWSDGRRHLVHRKGC